MAEKSRKGKKEKKVLQGSELAQHENEKGKIDERRAGQQQCEKKVHYRRATERDTDSWVQGEQMHKITGWLRNSPPSERELPLSTEETHKT